MPNTYTQLYIHAVFVVKGRSNLISPKFKEELYKYICGIATGKNQKIYAINGMPDHLHIILSMRPEISLSDHMRDIKANSSKWINERKFVRGKFQWQEGFGGFSVSKRDLDRVISYIKNQETHHAKKSFRTEYLELLEEYDIPYDEKYLFEFIEY